MTSAPDPSSTAQVSSLVEAHVQEIVEAAERTARALAQEIEAASVRRATEVRREAETDAAAIRETAEAEARAYTEEARRRSATWAAGRIARMEELSDALVTGCDAIRQRLPEAEQLHRDVEDLVASLASAARATAAEASRPPDDPAVS